MRTRNLGGRQLQSTAKADRVQSTARRDAATCLQSTAQADGCRFAANCTKRRLSGLAFDKEKLSGAISKRVNNVARIGVELCRDNPGNANACRTDRSFCDDHLRY
jgi:hypothetical protein